MTHIKWPNELGPPVPHEPNWQNEAMRQSALLHQALSQKIDLEIKLAKAIEGLKFYSEQEDYEEQMVVRDCGCCSYPEDPIILDDKGNLARKVLAELEKK